MTQGQVTSEVLRLLEAAIRRLNLGVDHAALARDVAEVLTEMATVKQGGYGYFEGKYQAGKLYNVDHHLSRKVDSPDE
jgi:hypothetical protein